MKKVTLINKGGQGMKKLLVLLFIVLIFMLLIYNITQKKDFEFGTYDSKELVRIGLSSTFNPINPVGKPTGMEYIIGKSKFVIRYVNEDKYSTLPRGKKEFIFNNVKYEEVTRIPDYKITIWESIVEELESVELHKILDENNNKIDYEIVILNGELYIMERNLFNIDMIKMRD